jgi:hypothetical protein
MRSALHRVASQHERSRRVEPHQRIHRIDEDDAAMPENPLELGSSFGVFPCRQIRQSANADRIERSETPIEGQAARGEIVSGCTLKNRSALLTRCRTGTPSASFAATSWILPAGCT